MSVLTFLNPSANETSRRLALLAESLVANCPVTLGEEIALVGSVARGQADSDSDLDFNCWVRGDIPDTALIQEWLALHGITNPVFEAMKRPDESFWGAFEYAGVGVECGWQSFDAMERFLVRLHDGKIESLRDIRVAEIMSSAVAVRSTGQLARWQARLQAYSDALQKTVITLASAGWQHPSWEADRTRCLHENDETRFRQLIQSDLENIIAIIFALNRRYPPKWKWVESMRSQLLVQPPDLGKRLVLIQSNPPSANVLLHCRQLINDVLGMGI